MSCERLDEAPLCETPCLWIPLRDGVRLAAHLWRPETAHKKPVPAILEYIPYRRRDMTALRDAQTHPYLARRGYACLRLDVRGTGDSQGLYNDPFAPILVEDGIEAIAWIAEQSWCSGEVALFGLSWGAAMALRIAARSPPALKAVCCSAGFDDWQELLFPGGALACSTFSMAAAQLSYATRPPDPTNLGARWMAQWRDRLDSAQPLLGMWLRQRQRQEPCSVYRSIRCPVFISAGYADPFFASAMMRGLQRISSPCVGLFGPWGHRYPHLGPGPSVGYLQDVLRFLDFHLKDRPLPAIPRLRFFLPSDFSTTPYPEDREGRWMSLDSDSEQDSSFIFYRLGDGLLARSDQPNANLDIPASLLFSERSGEIMPLFSSLCSAELPGDQQEDDARSLTFDSDALTEATILMGAPSLRLSLWLDGPSGAVIGRLCDVAPDGRSRRLSWGVCSLLSGQARADSNGAYAMTLHFHALADRIVAGHKLRLALSSSYWPLIWPETRAMPMRMASGSARLFLPRLSQQSMAATFPEAATTACGLTWQTLIAPRYERSMRYDAARRQQSLTLIDDMGQGRIAETGLVFGEKTLRRFTHAPGQVSDVSLETEIDFYFESGPHKLQTRVNGRVANTPTGLLRTEHRLEAWQNGEAIVSKIWQDEHPSVSAALLPSSA